MVTICHHCQMDFNTYLSESKRSHSDVAKQLGVSTSYISYLRSGRRNPSMKMVARISEITAGVVSFNDWLMARE